MRAFLPQVIGLFLSLFWTSSLPTFGTSAFFIGPTVLLCSLSSRERYRIWKSIKKKEAKEGNQKWLPPYIASIRGGGGDDSSTTDAKGSRPNTVQKLSGVENASSPWSQFLTLFFRGVTLPFPTLRILASQKVPKISGREKDEEDTGKSTVGLSLKESILAILIYLTLGVISYKSTLFHNGNQTPWSLVDALYFGVVTFTSVGYGDLYPTTTIGKLFTILFGLSGIALLGAAIATIGSRLVERENNMVAAAQDASRKRVLGVFQSLFSTTASSNAESVGENKCQDNDKKDDNDLPLWRQTLQSLLQKSVPAFVALVVGGVMMGRIEGWSITDSIYYSFITAGTLGYGDYSPTTQNGRLWGIIFIPLSVAAAGEIFGNVATAFLEHRQDRFYKALMERELNVDRLLEMDTDADGKVSREEYVQFMLKEMDLVSEEQFDELHAQFKELDMDGGGFLDKKDLRLKMYQKDIRDKILLEKSGGET